MNLLPDFWVALEIAGAILVVAVACFVWWITLKRRKKKKQDSEQSENPEVK